jgi:hypothetical protein
MTLTKALVWWNKHGKIEDHDDTMFVAGYQKALEDAANMAESLLGGEKYDPLNKQFAQSIRRLDDLPMDMGN